MCYAIDPGSEQSAIVSFNGKTISFARIMPNAELLAMLRASKAALNGATVAIELIGHYGKGMPAGREVFDTCIFIGEAKEAAVSSGAKVQLVLRKWVTTHLCGSATAKDKNVSQALRDKYGEKGTAKNPGPLFGIKDDLWSALAVADYALSH